MRIINYNKAKYLYNFIELNLKRYKYAKKYLNPNIEIHFFENKYKEIQMKSIIRTESNRFQYT